MVKHFCNKCGKEFSQKSHYNAHINKKNPCIYINDSLNNSIIAEIKNVIETNNDKVKDIVKNIILDKYTNSDLNSNKKEDDIKDIEEENIIQNITKKEDNIKDTEEKNIIQNITKKKHINSNKKKTNIKDTEEEKNIIQNITIKEDNIKDNNYKIKMIDLCAGTGAFTYAFEQTKLVDVVFANDLVQTSKLIYDLNFNHKLTLGNICDIDVESIPAHNILTAGFPCQPFSIAGKQMGFDDDRSNVFWKIIKIIKYHKPQCVILENVKNLVSHDDGNTFKKIKESLEEEKYNIIYKILNTSDITNIPQHRERIYIVCIKDKTIFDNFNLNFKKITKYPIKNILEKNRVNDKYYYNNEENKIHKMVMDTVTNENSVYQFRRIYVRENKNNECPTLTANMGMGGHNVPIILDNNGARKLTPRECFNFQGFPDNYKLPNLSDSPLYKLAGNAVSVPVVKLIADRIVPELYKLK
jgi:DNA (cytosine-5)-methyltransferase 1